MALLINGKHPYRGRRRAAKTGGLKEFLKKQFSKLFLPKMPSKIESKIDYCKCLNF